MYGRKRQRPASADFHHVANKKQSYSLPHNASKLDNLWNVLPKVTQDNKISQLPIERIIKHSQILIRITEEQRLKLPIFLADLRRALELETITLHESFVELKAFTLLQASVAITAILNYLYRLSLRPEKDIKYWDVESACLLRGSLLVHKSVKIQQTETTSDILFKRVPKRKSFKCQLSAITAVPQFKEVYLEGETVKEFMAGIITSMNNWRFRPVHASVNDLASQNIALLKQRITASTNELPILTKLFDPEILRSKNKQLINNDQSVLESYMKELIEYNDKLPVINVSDSKSKQKTANGTAKAKSHTPSKVNNPTSRYKGGSNIPAVTPTSSSRVGNHTKGQSPNPSLIPRATLNSAISSQDLQAYCIETIKSSISKVSAGSSFQIIKSYVKYPKSHIDLIYDNLNQIKSTTNCNIVVLNLQTIHESNAWFQQLELDSNLNPPTNLTRVISVGGVGGKCKTALEMILTLLQTGSL